MKKPIQLVFALLLCAALAVGGSGCGMLKTIRENARIASERKILENPAEEELASVFNQALPGSAAACKKLSESVSFEIGKPRVEGEGAGADILRAAANTLKSLIMQSAPGSSSREVDPADLGDTLLKNVAPADVVKGENSRNEANVAVTDADGKELTDEEGNVKMTSVVTDNILYITMNFNDIRVYTETDDEGNPQEKTEIVPPEKALVEKYFGVSSDRDAVLQEFGKLKGYLQVNDYTVEYKDCKVLAVLNMDTSELSEVRYTKNFTVTAAVTGVGPFAEMGDLTVSFDGAEITDYTFSYLEDAE